MAPIHIEDDFIFTLSDNDDLPNNDLESESPESFKIQRGTKRKREKSDNSKYDKIGNARSKHNPLKKIKHSNPQSETSSDDEEIQDGAIESDFEFDVGGGSFVNGIEDFDAWVDLESSKKQKENKNKKGVDLEGIIARKTANRQKTNSTIKGNLNTEDDNDVQSTEASEPSDEDDIAEDIEPDSVPNFEDDELLADDTFGADAPSDDDQDGEDSEDSQRVQQENDDESEDSSVASPMAHPDDIQPEESEAESSTSDEAEATKRAAFFAPESNTSPNSNNLLTSFQQFSLSRPILRAVAALSFTTPTPIQTKTIPVALQGVDVVGSAVTGSGKTAAFLLPILERLLYRPRKVPTTRVVILMPTRELAVQCYNMATALARFTDVTFAQIVGGFSVREQEIVLRKRPDVVIATPGRFIDHMRNSASFATESIEILVLDEADRMLDTGFEDELDEILKTLPKGRQTMLFSATMTNDIDKLIRVGMNRPVRVSADARKSTTAGLTQEFVRLRPGREEMRLATLCVLCTQVFKERTIVFFKQKVEAHRVRIIFGLLGLKAGELHGNMSQEQRLNAVHDFRDGKTTHMLATDLASRGLDIKNVMTVINYEAPQSHEIYLHRVGRTARAGKSGRSCTIAAEPDRKVVQMAVKSGRKQGAKIVSRAMDIKEVDEMNETLTSFASDIEAIVREEKEEKQFAQAEMQLTKGENLVRHESEIMSRPKRTWFESEKQKKDAKLKGRVELNGPDTKGKKERTKLSNKDKKRLDDQKTRSEGKLWRKGKELQPARKTTKGSSGKGKVNGKVKRR